MSVVDWSTLTTAERFALVTGPNIVVDAGGELVDFVTLEPGDDISADLDPTGGDVSWTGAGPVHRDCEVILSRVLDWGVALVRLYLILTNSATGMAAKRSLGVFNFSAPTQPMGNDPTSYQVTGRDRIYFLTRQVGYSYFIAAGANVLAALAQVFTAAGLSGVVIDATAAAVRVPTDMVWPLLPVSDTSSATTTVTLPDDSGEQPDDSSSPATWLQIVNDLLGLIGYRAVWCDENGYYQCAPYVDPSLRDATFTFDSDDALASPVSMDDAEVDRTIATVNEWIFVNSSLPDVDGVPATPTEGAGQVTLSNETDGPSSIAALGGRPVGVWPTQVTFAAADQATLVQLGEARKASDMRTVAAATVDTVPYPAASHFDVFTWLADGLDEGSWKVEASSWSLPLDGGDMQWAWTKVA